MRYLKMVGLAGLAAAALLAAFGSASAPADVLCKEAPNAAGECKTPGEGGLGSYASGSVFEGTAKTVTFATTPENIVCESTMNVKTTSAGGAKGTAVTSSLAGLTFKACHTEPNNKSCTVELERQWGGFDWIATDNKGHGFLIATESGAIQVTCPSLKCVFRAEPSLSVTGGNPATVSAIEVGLGIEEREGFLECPKEASWSGSYTIKSPLWPVTKDK
jgi:hypothetical protein